MPADPTSPAAPEPLATATIRWDEGFLGRYWHECSRYRGHGTLWKILVLGAPLCLAAGGAVLLLVPEPGALLRFLAWLTLFMGVFAVAWYFGLRWYMNRTLRRMPLFGHEVSIAFFDGWLTHRGPTGEGRILYHAFREVQATPHGLFLRPTAGVIYVEDAGLDPPEAKEQIVRRVGEALLHAAAGRGGRSS